MDQSDPVSEEAVTCIDNRVLNKDLVRMTEEIADASVHLAWISYELVAIRTNIELAEGMRKLREAYSKCKAVFCGEEEQEAPTEESTETASTTPDEL